MAVSLRQGRAVEKQILRLRGYETVPPLGVKKRNYTLHVLTHFLGISLGNR